MKSFVIKQQKRSPTYILCILGWAPWNQSCLKFLFDDTRPSYWHKNKIGRIDFFLLLPSSANLILMSIGKSGIIKFEFQTTLVSWCSSYCTCLILKITNLYYPPTRWVEISYAPVSRVLGANFHVNLEKGWYYECKKVP